MRWDEIDMGDRIWRIPMTKNGKPQVVPLEAPELKILQRQQADAKCNPWVFPGRSDNTSGHLTRPEKGGPVSLHAPASADCGCTTSGPLGQALHHQSQSTTAIYARMSLDPVRHAKSQALNAILASGKPTPEENAAQKGLVVGAGCQRPH